MYLENAPAYENLDGDYEWSASFSAEKLRREADEPILHHVHAPFRRWCKKLLRPNKFLHVATQFISPGRVLDVGCGSGRRLANLPRYLTPFGIEISQRLASQADRIFSSRGGNVFHGPALQWLAQLEPNHFSGIVMMSYLEHEINPRGALRGANRVLTDGGHMIIKVPNYASLNRKIRGSKWCGFRLPDHVNYFTPQSISTIVCESGFSIVRFGWRDRLPTSDSLWLVARKES